MAKLINYQRGCCFTVCSTFPVRILSYSEWNLDGTNGMWKHVKKQVLKNHKQLQNWLKWRSSNDRVKQPQWHWSVSLLSLLNIVGNWQILQTDILQNVWKGDKIITPVTKLLQLFSRKVILVQTSNFIISSPRRFGFCLCSFHVLPTPSWTFYYVMTLLALPPAKNKFVCHLYQWPK